jgi:hypothetical protein
VATPHIPDPDGLDTAHEWFWTGIPAGFILAVIGGVLWLILDFWLSALVVLVVVGLGARVANRDGQESLIRYLAGTAVLLVPGFVIWGFIKSLLNI